MKKFSLFGIVLAALLVSSSFAATGDLVKDGVQAQDLTGVRSRGGPYIVQLPTSTSISGATLYGTCFQSVTNKTEVTAYVTQSMHSGVSPAFMVFQNAISGVTPLSVKLPPGDSLIGAPGFNPTVDYFYISPGGWLSINGTGGTSLWFLSGTSGVSIKKL